VVTGTTSPSSCPGSTRPPRGRPRRKPRRLYADRGYDFDKYRRLLWKCDIKPVIARRGAAHGSGLGKVCWVAERTLAWLHQVKRLRTRYEPISIRACSNWPAASMPAPPANLVLSDQLATLNHPGRTSSRSGCRDRTADRRP
jgi:transposase